MHGCHGNTFQLNSCEKQIKITGLYFITNQTLLVFINGLLLLTSVSPAYLDYKTRAQNFKILHTHLRNLYLTHIAVESDFLHCFSTYCAKTSHLCSWSDGTSDHDICDNLSMHCCHGNIFNDQKKIMCQLEINCNCILVFKRSHNSFVTYISLYFMF